MKSCSQGYESLKGVDTSSWGKCIMPKSIRGAWRRHKLTTPRLWVHMLRLSRHSSSPRKLRSQRLWATSLVSLHTSLTPSSGSTLVPALPRVLGCPKGRSQTQGPNSNQAQAQSPGPGCNLQLQLQFWLRLKVRFPLPKVPGPSEDAVGTTSVCPCEGARTAMTPGLLYAWVQCLPVLSAQIIWRQS